MQKILREPLVHFLVIGIALFGLFELTASDDSAYDSKVIDVDRSSLLTFVQFRTRAFQPEIAAARLDAMSEAELERLIADYVREEALHREALALGVDQNDYVIKQRMIQSIEFITNGFVTSTTELTDDDVREYFEANRDDYFNSPWVTFTHVYFSTDGRERDDVLARARAKLDELNAGPVPFSEAPGHGERFPYFVNYVERPPDFIASHFGTRMAENVFSLEPDESSWKGPFDSAYGIHLVLLTRKDEGRYPDLAEIEDAVRGDAERELIEERQQEAIQAIVGTYEVRRSFEQVSAE